MKKIIAIILSVLTTVGIAVALAGCAVKIPELDEDTALEIRTAYYEQNEKHYQSVEKVIIENYYGKYNGYYVVGIYTPNLFNGEIGAPNIDGIRFIMPVSTTITAYSNGNFYELFGAYYNGFLTRKDLIRINKIHRKFYSELYKDY